MPTTIKIIGISLAVIAAMLIALQPEDESA
jgi:uncharacterized membrane protein